MAKGRLSPLMILPPVIFLGLAALFYVGMFREGKDELRSMFIGKPAPSIEQAKSLPGYPPVTQADFARGEVTLVNFWASWCPPCRAEHPKLLELSKDYPIIGVNIRDLEDQATAYLEKEDSPFVGVVFDPTGRTSIDWGVTAPPETFILDGDGTVLFRFAGPLVGSDYEQRFLPALEKALAK